MRIGNRIERYHAVMALHLVAAVSNGNREKMFYFCIDNNILTGNTFFPYKTMECAHRLSLIHI